MYKKVKKLNLMRLVILICRLMVSYIQDDIYKFLQPIVIVIIVNIETIFSSGHYGPLTRLINRNFTISDFNPVHYYRIIFGFFKIAFKYYKIELFKRSTANFSA